MFCSDLKFKNRLNSVDLAIQANIKPHDESIFNFDLNHLPFIFPIIYTAYLAYSFSMRSFSLRCFHSFLNSYFYDAFILSHSSLIYLSFSYSSWFLFDSFAFYSERDLYPFICYMRSNCRSRLAFSSLCDSAREFSSF